MRYSTISLVALLLLALNLSHCGQRGPLQRPDENPAAQFSAPPADSHSLRESV